MNIDEKFKYLVRTLTSYKVSVKTLNKLGLFDEAKWFELLVKEILNVLFNKSFYNLNDFKSSYPGVDLRSADNTVDVQVSTTDKINSKIKYTFEVILRNKLDIKEIYFVFLSNRVFSSKNQTYPKYFDPELHIYNLDRIIRLISSKAKYIDSVYDVFKRFFDSGSFITKFYDLLEFSEHVIETQITSKINNNLEIIRDDSSVGENSHIMITGDAGYGKSVFAKQIAPKGSTLFIRSDQFVASDLRGIWGFDIVKAFEYICIDRNLTILIDSLESLSDSHQNDLLSYFLEKILLFDNIKVIFTCRTSEITRFTKLISDYKIKELKIEPFNETEMNQVYEKYPELKSINKLSSLHKMISVPFYLNLILSYGIDYNQINDENAFRDYIWDSIIAKNQSQKITFTQIVKDRSSSFCVSVPKDDYDLEAVKLLINEGVLVEYHNQVKSKYDIFEDICFERIIDKFFESSRADYSTFFNRVETIGKCSHRRYQIWVSNKLLEKENSEKFIAGIVFSQGTSNWKNQTIIGILKSKQADKFIRESIHKFSDINIIYDFLININLYGYDIKYASWTNGVRLVPRINGRQGILLIIYKFKVFEIEKYYNSILKFLDANLSCGFA